MYLQYFGLREPPFSIAPNPRYLFMSERHREALAHLVYGLQGTGGFVVLTGEVGAGKTTLARRFLEEIPANCRVAYLINPNVTTAELLQTICDEFGIKVASASRRSDEPPSIKAWVDAINAFLLSEYAAGRNCVVIVDEAQNLTPEVMEQLRLLTNLETDERKLLQIILIGQPELRDLLARHDLRQVDQRVVARYHLDSLDVQDTEHYLAHRLAIAGGQPDLFAPAVAASVHAWTDGVPRRINVLADRALLGAYAQGLPQVTVELINKAAGEVFQGRVGKGSKPSTAAYGKTGNSATAAIVKPLLWIAGVAAAAVVGYAAVNNGTLKLPFASDAPKASSSPANAVNNSNTPQISPSTASINQGNTHNPVASISAVSASQKPSLDSLIASSTVDATLRQSSARALLQLWRVTSSASPLKEPVSTGLCEAAIAAQLACYSGKTGLEALRANNHPVLITLSKHRASVPALLDRLDATSARVTIGNTPVQLSQAELMQVWQGDFVAMWKPLMGDAQRPTISNLLPGAQGPAVADMLMRLSAAKSLPAELAAAATSPAPRYDAAVQAAVRAFQMSQGLAADGGAGPQTLLRLNALSVSDQPRLTPPAASVAAKP
jgi:general secretion pathway protein A